MPLWIDDDRYADQEDYRGSGVQSDSSCQMVNVISNLICSLKQSNRNSSATWNVGASLEQMFDTKFEEADIAIFPVVEDKPDKQADAKKCPGC